MQPIATNDRAKPRLLLSLLLLFEYSRTFRKCPSTRVIVGLLTSDLLSSKFELQSSSVTEKTIKAAARAPFATVGRQLESYSYRLGDSEDVSFLCCLSLLGEVLFTGRQLAMLRSSCPSVLPSIRLSVTRSHCVKTTLARITKSTPTDSPRTLVSAIKSSSGNSKGFSPSEGVKREWSRKNSQFSATKSPYLRNGAK